jgi:hypothetical protein
MGKGPQNNSNDADMRMHPRSAYVTNVSYREVGDDDAAHPLQGEGLTQNISYAGICLILDREFSRDATLELKFERTEMNFKPIVMLAKVVWQKKTEMGFLTGLKFKID